MLRAVRVGTLLVGVSITAITACGVALIGGSAEETSGSGTDASSPSDSSDSGAAAVDEAGNPIVGDGSVAGGDDAEAGGFGDGGATCPISTTSFVNGRLTVAPAALPVTIDGDLGEWGCATQFTFNKDTAAVHEGSNKNIPNTYTFAVSWDPSFIYVAVRATDPTAKEGNTTPDVFNNDGVELYLGGDDVFNGTYTSKDHQWVVDWANRTREYRGDTGRAPSANFTSAVKTTPNGFQIEMRVAASELGRSSGFPMNDKLGIAFVGLDSDGTARSSWMLWYRPGNVCGGGCCQIWCNTNFFGELVLGP